MSSEKTCAVSGCGAETKLGLCDRHFGMWLESPEAKRAEALSVPIREGTPRHYALAASAKVDFATRVGLEELRDREAAREAK